MSTVCLHYCVIEGFQVEQNRKKGLEFILMHVSYNLQTELKPQMH